MQQKTAWFKVGLLIISTVCVAQSQSGFAQSSTSTPSPAGTTDTAASSSTASASGSSSSTTTKTSTTSPSTSSPSPTESNEGTIIPSEGNANGIFNFQADLFTGRFTYTVPIRVAPARQGAEPKITLGYNSAAGNGWCGVGWSLDMGYIQRDTRHGVPVLWDSTNAQPAYDDSKGFVANVGGAMGTLVRVSGTNQNPIVYRQQVDTAFLTYNYYTNNYWTVVDKSGNTFYFGEGSTNQMENPKTNWVQGAGSSTFRWSLDRVVDANGNETFLQYETDNGTLYLTNISYNANVNSPNLPADDTVSFILTNRPDTNFTYISNYRVQVDKLLSEIDVRADGQDVCKYVLGYTQSPSTSRSLLNSVTQYGSDYTTALPPITFHYQVQSFTFGPDIAWPINSPGDGDNLRGVSDSLPQEVAAYYYLDQNIDIDGDGLPDRVTMEPSGDMMQSPDNGIKLHFQVLQNTGANYASPNQPNYYVWDAPYQVYYSSLPSTLNMGTNSTEAVFDLKTYVGMFDMNGDGYPDRVLSDDFDRDGFTLPPNTWLVQTNTGIQGTNAGAGFPFGMFWTNVDDDAWNGVIQYDTYADLMDMNDDGLPDRVLAEGASPYDQFLVQFNTGSGFTSPCNWLGLDSQGQTNATWNGLSQMDNTGNREIIMADINGDGLPDRIMRLVNPPFTNFVVQFNNGAGFEPAQPWGPLDSQGETNASWNSPIGTDGARVWSTLADINGDGLLDRIEESTNSTVTNWWVQFNTGSGFAPPVEWGPLQGPPDISAKTYGNSSTYTVASLFDINGDGLPDRVTCTAFKQYGGELEVQLNQGPFPDLLSVVSNGLGGSVQVSYVASTTLNNWDKHWTNDPLAEGAKCLLPFNVWVVSNIVVNDGMNNSSTNTYAFRGGYYNAAQKEFRGFSRCTVTDPLGTRTTTYFHQSGGLDNSALGEYEDQGSEAKKGIPFRIETIGNDGATNKIVLNKVEEVELNSNGWYFPFIAQTIVMDYEGLSSYRAVAKQFVYDTNTENLVETANLGEVTNVVVQGQTFAEVGNDSIYTWITYTNIGNILDDPSDVENTSDSAGQDRLRETRMSYDSSGRLTSSEVWLNTTGTFIPVGSDIYDQYGNLIQSTDAAGITTTTTYDPTYEQYPIMQVTGTFTNYATPDIRSGLTLTATDAKGLVTSNSYDVFFRPTASYISTNAYGPPILWQTRTSYSLGGIANGISYNYICQQENDDVDPVNGYVTYTYSDGLGRAIESRAEAETGQYRVANTLYDLRGNPYYQTLPYFSSGTGYTVLDGTYLGALTEYDDMGRAFRVTPAEQAVFSSGQLQSMTTTGGDTGSPEGPSTTAFVDGSNPWATVVTDPEGKVNKSYRDAYGRTIMITEVTSNGDYNTTYSYDLLGDPTNATDSAGNHTVMEYDSLGRKISMTDPDMGTWTYAYDDAGRMTQQTDARGDVIKFFYNDQLGRLTSKQIYNANGQLTGTVTYTYDKSDDPNYTVYPGQLYEVTDSQGYERYSYDVRGRVLKNDRFLKINSMNYVTQANYDDADRLKTLTYPGDAATIEYSYDTAGNLNEVKSLSGTGTQEIFYVPEGFNELGQPLGCLNGNGVETTNIYYANSKRLQRSVVFKGTNVLQDLTYTYDSVSDVKSINDGAYTGAASASISSISYDDLYRVTSVNSTARGLKTYAYNPIGNIMTNQDFGPGAYVYGSSKPHAVTSANGISYSYDACGNMITRGNQTLTYDAQNELTQVSTTNDTVTFGYDDSGERLWRDGTNGYTIWINGIYEIHNGKVLCHVLANGQLVATFEPLCGGLWSKVFGKKNWYVASRKIQSAVNWPLQSGHAQITILSGTWVGIIGLCMVAGRKKRLRGYELRKSLRCSALWRQLVTVASISAYLWAGMGNADAGSATYNPVFYYYYTNSLGSSNILTDRSGNVVQHYEYGTFGVTTYTANSSAFPMSNLYTGQIYDDETGLYYYGARYYDAQLGRFIQPDSTVPAPDSPQTLNRYSYCINNPLNYVDPSGNCPWCIIIAVIIGALAGGAIAAATHQNVGLGILAGAVSGLLVGAGIAVGGTNLATAIGCSARVGAAIGGTLGGAAGGAAGAAIQGGNVGMGALIGGATGAAFGYLDYNNDFGAIYRTPSAVAQSPVASGDAWSGPFSGGLSAWAKSALQHIGHYFADVPDDLTPAEASSASAFLTSVGNGLSIGWAGVVGAAQGLAASFDGAISFTGWQPFRTLYADNPEAAGFSKTVGGFGWQTLATAGAGELLQAYRVPSTLYHFTSAENAALIRSQGIIKVGKGFQAFGKGVYASRWDSPIIATLMGARSVQASVSFSTKGLSVARTIIPGAFRVRGDVPLP